MILAYAELPLSPKRKLPLKIFLDKSITMLQAIHIIKNIKLIRPLIDFFIKYFFISEFQNELY